MSRKILWYVILPVAVLLFSNMSVLAGVSGKISGVVLDQKTGHPIEGATVRVIGTNSVTQTDLDGEYFVINVPSGKFDVSVSYLGYESIVARDVRVLVDLTTPVNFSLTDETVELSEKVVVSAVNPIIQRDLTSSRIIFTADQLRSLPNIITIQSVLTHYPGVIIDAQDDLHVRGGRSGQVIYYFDDFSVQDPFVANSGIRIIPSSLSELSLTSGGYTAEYGEAMSGVVNAVTPEGGSKYHGGIRAYEGFTHSYDVITGDWKDLKQNDNRAAVFNLSGPLPGLDPKRYTFFAAGEYLKNPSYLPANWEISYTGTSKLSIQPMANMKIKSNMSYFKSDGRVFTHRDQNGRSYDFNLDGLPAIKKEAYLVGFSGNYNFSERLIFSASVNRFYTMTKEAPPHLMDVYWDQWPGYSEDSNGVYNGTIHEDNYLGFRNRDFTDPYQATGFTVDDDFAPVYHQRIAAHNSIKLSAINQVNSVHQLKAGGEIRKYSLDWDEKKFYNDNPYGEKYTSKPVYASAFIQDKMEYDNFIVNAGVRFDYRDAGTIYNLTTLNATEDPKSAPAVFVESVSKSRFSPRLGVSFPITEKSMMHFNYGVYYQDPRYEYLYTNLAGDISTGYPILGNPNLAPERTTSYEIGLDHLIGDNLRLDVTAYYKDINELVATRSSYTVGGLAVTHFDNDDYGTAQGFDISLERLRLGGFFNASVAYSYMIAAGIGSDALESYYTYLTSFDDTLPPLSKYPLNFDQRHTITGVLTWEMPREWNGNMLGLKIPGAWGATFVGHYGSGLPFTATDVFGNRLGERNASRLPANSTVDMRIHKDFFPVGGVRRVSFFVEVDNMFDKRNILNVYSRTGQPDSDGNLFRSGLASDDPELSRLDRLYDHDPQNYSPPRTIRTGLEYSF